MNKQSGGAVARGTLGSPEFLQPLVDREFPIGEPAVLEVRIAGSAPLTVQWYHNSQPVRESIEKDIRLLQKGTIEFHLRLVAVVQENKNFNHGYLGTGKSPDSESRRL